MKRIALALGFFAALLAAGGCKKQQNDNDAIRAGMIQHPDPNQNPHQNQDVHSGGLPRFNDVLNPVAAPAQGSLPAGHPPAKSQPPAAQLGGQDQASAKKPL